LREAHFKVSTLS